MTGKGEHICPVQHSLHGISKVPLITYKLNVTKTAHVQCKKCLVWYNRMLRRPSNEILLRAECASLSAKHFISSSARTKTFEPGALLLVWAHCREWGTQSAGWDAVKEEEAFWIVKEVEFLADQVHGFDAVTDATTWKGRINGHKSWQSFHDHLHCSRACGGEGTGRSC